MSNNPNGLFHFNGVNGENGQYILPPMSGKELAAFIQGEQTPDNLAELRFRRNTATQEHLGVKEGVDPKKLAEAGWGILFAHNADPALIEALDELICHRQAQTGDRFRLYTGGDGFRVGRDTKTDFLARHGAGPGPADPDKVPYYLLIVGSPEVIPYRFQSQLDVRSAVGRIHFDTLQEYANYAASVVAAETQALKLPRQMTFFSVANPDDNATQMSTEYLVQPVHHLLSTEHDDWAFELIQHEQATKANLTSLLGGGKTPALLFSSSHGMGFPFGSQRQIPHQGALLCQDWPGPNEWNREIPQDFYFAGDDLSAGANLLGLISFFFACYGAGTPDYDDFSKIAFKAREQIAQQPFVSRLPASMLSHANGGALAVIGHVDRAWSYSFIAPNAGQQTVVFESTLKRLLDGHPVGSALEYFNERHAELSVTLTDELEEIEFGKMVDEYELADMWTANNDARGYAIIGDPAVRLAVAQPDEKVVDRSTLTVKPENDSFGAPAMPAPVESITETPTHTVYSTVEPAILEVSTVATANSSLFTVSTYLADEVADDITASTGRTLVAKTQLLQPNSVETTIARGVDAEIRKLHQAVVKRMLAQAHES